MKGEPLLNGLKKLREAMGLTQEALALLVGVSHRQVTRWETEPVRPRNPAVDQRICEVLGCTWKQLMGLSEAA